MKPLRRLKKSELKEKVLQFGEGNFLRAFVDYLIDEMNRNNLFNGAITIVQPIANGMAAMLNEQDGLYTLIARGIQNGKTVDDRRIIESVTKAINPYEDFEQYKKCIENPDLRIIVSNTTEAGICYSEEEHNTNGLQNTFPAKITSLLYERFKFFNGDPKKGFIFLPCELIDNNGSNLKKIVLRYADDWNLGEAFASWVESANYFTNTLVDRIVTGYPRDEAEKLTGELGYTDNLIDTCEIFYLFVIEGPKEIHHELPFHEMGLNVIWTDDATNYKMRKVRILNGGHTMSIFSAFLSGKDTVKEMVSDKNLKAFLHKGIFEEIIPTLDLPNEELVQFANDVLERFANPYIKHALLSISLNSVSKFKVRVLPSILEYIKRKNDLPKTLCFALASLLMFYRGDKLENNILVGTRNGESYNISDDLFVLEYFLNAYKDLDITNKTAVASFASDVCGNKDFWDIDLNSIEGFTDCVAESLYNILNGGVYEEVVKIVEAK